MEKRLATANVNLDGDSSDENLSYLSLIHDLISRSELQTVTTPTVFKNQLMLQGKSLPQQVHKQMLHISRSLRRGRRWLS